MSAPSGIAGEGAAKRAAARPSALLAALALAWGCSGGEAPAPGAAPAPPNVVLFLIDTLRVDRLGAYGYQRAHTPSIDALARSGIVFERAYAPGPWTLPSVVSLLTSTFMCEHAVLVDGQQLPEDLDPLAQRLREAGFATASFYANPYAGPMTGLDRGYEHSEAFESLDPEAVGAWLDRRGERPFLLYVHIMEPHDPYNARARYSERAGAGDRALLHAAKRGYDYYRELTRVDFVSEREVGTTDNTRLQDAALAYLQHLREPISELYDAKVDEADTRVGLLVETLRERGLWEETLFVLVSDHGEELGEHGGWLHDQSAYEELLHVPLVLRLPGDAHAGARIPAVVSLVDLLPTVLDVLGLPELTRGARGRSLVPLFGGGAAAGRDALVVPALRMNRKKYYRPWKRSRGDDNVVVRLGEWKGIFNVESDSLELYDLATDPGETRNRADARPELAASMRAHAAGWLAECRTGSPGGGERRPIDDETRERLRALGYL